MERLQEIIKDDNPGTWDIAWQEQVTPWEAEVIQPPLRELIESGDIAFPTSGRALVPGCGSVSLKSFYPGANVDRGR